MDAVKVLVLLTIIYCVWCKEESSTVKEEEDIKNDKNREAKQLQLSEYEEWRTLDRREREDADDWVPKPKNHEVHETALPRRRRIRKRKRRPPIFDDDSQEFEEYAPPRKRPRPQTLEDIDDSWVDMEDDYVRRPANRRRITPIFSPEGEVFDEDKERPIRFPVYEKVRDPFTALAEAEAKAQLKKKQSEETTTVSSLKALLKQTSGTLSLSEVLQRKNLSLTDLLKGKEQAISALTERTDITTVPITKNLIEDQTTPTSTSRTNLYPERRIEHKGTIKNYEVLNEPTTDRRIFVPSHPKYYTSLTYKPKKPEVEPEEPTTQPPTTTTRKNLGNKRADYRSKFGSLKPKLKANLPMTNAKLNNFTKLGVGTTTLPPKAFKIDIKDLFGVTNASEAKDEGPLRMSFDLNALVNKTTEEPLLVSTKENEVVEKLHPLTARDEIMEILRDHASRQNLSRILELRNMTIEELVAQRERGSSQLHLADIFHNKTREPEPPSEPFVGHVAAVSGLVDRQAKTVTVPVEIKKDSQGSNYIASVIDIKPVDISFNTESSSSEEEPVVPTKQRYTVTSFPTYKIEMEKILKNNNPPPFQLSVWKSLYPNLYTGEVDAEKNKKVQVKVAKVDESLINEAHRVEDIENQISKAVNDQLNIEVNDNNYEDDNGYLRLPPGVKSAIIASSVIVGISLFVFLTILVIFKWSQRQKKRLSYSDSFSCSRIKSPILDAGPKRTLRTIMTETLGRKKNYMKYPQNMSDYLWDTDKKPFQ